MAKYNYWTLDNQDEYIFLTLDLPKTSQNVLSSFVLKELDEVLNEVEQQSGKGLIIQSAKQDSFISGADISEFEKIESATQAEETVGVANRIIDRIENLKIPTVALINGHCLGGGLELALACKYRVACDSTSIRLGLPEIKLGIHPGFGGTVRLIETIGAPTAMDLILSGRTVNPFTAKKLGIVDLCVAPRQLDRAAKHILDKAPKARRAKHPIKALNFFPARHLMAKFLEKQVKSKANPNHYPAPYAVIKVWKEHGGNRQNMFKAEQKSIAQLFGTSTSKNLVKVYYLQEELKGLGKNNSKSEFNHVHVIGAGVMGGDIASWCALRGLQVTIHDRSAEALARATARAYQLFKRKLKQDRLIERAMDRFHQDLSGDGARNADVIIEAIFENAEAKIGVFKEMEKVAKPDAILASNTSSIPLESISSALKKPGRLVGLHFFNPVAKMQLVEIVQGEKTLTKIHKQAAAFAGRIGRLPVPVKSSPGFLVNRVLMPYTLEAVALLNEGVPGPLIDKIATDFGMPMGPITLADTVGLDICFHVGKNLTEAYGGELPDLLQQKIDQGNLGKKTGKGFYTWVKGRPEKEKYDENYAVTDIQDRLIYRYLNECVACLHDGIVSEQSHIDGALIFGTGFAPFSGGPMNYIKDNDPATMLDRLKQLNTQYGERFVPSEGWQQLLDP